VERPALTQFKGNQMTTHRKKNIQSNLFNGAPLHLT